MQTHFAAPPAHTTLRAITALCVVLSCAALLQGQVRSGSGIYPPSSVEQPSDVGVNMHTNYLIYAPSGSIIPAAQPAGETPASLGCVYDVVANPVSGCPIDGTTEVPTGGSGVIVIVDAYDYPRAASDLATFSSTFRTAGAEFRG